MKNFVILTRIIISRIRHQVVSELIIDRKKGVHDSVTSFIKF